MVHTLFLWCWQKSQFIIILILIPFYGVTQSSTTTYYLDPAFSTHDFVRGESPVGGVFDVGDGSLICYGEMEPSAVWNTTQDRGFAHINADGSEAPWNHAEFSSVQYFSEHGGGYICVASTQGIAKLTYSGDYWVNVHGVNWGDYFHGLWSEPNPYNVQNVWSLYIQDDQKVLIGGGIATDTLQPYHFRILSRLNADGSHDATFPVIETNSPNNPFITITRINKDSQGRWYLTGDFHGINGHDSNYIARLNPDFTVDTTFTSPFQYTDFPAITPQVVLVDSDDRVWISGYKMVVAATPTDSLSVARLLPDGSFDESFYPKYLKAMYPDTFGYRQEVIWRGREMENHNYMLYGTFTHFNDTIQNCITVVDDNGFIQTSYFQGSRVLKNDPFPSLMNSTPDRPAILGVTELDDGSLILCGLFSEYDGVQHYNVVKLNKGTLGMDNLIHDDRLLTLSPNPASDVLNIHFSGSGSSQLSVFNMSGKLVLNQEIQNAKTQIDVSDFQAGIYILWVKNGRMQSVQKFVVE